MAVKVLTDQENYTREEIFAAIDAGWIEGARLSKGAVDVLEERDRQMSQEGWSVEHDDSQKVGQLARAGACYALSGAFGDPAGENMGWVWKMIKATWPTPWDWRWWKPKDRRRDLVRAAALIIAEIERLDRAASHVGDDFNHLAKGE